MVTPAHLARLTRALLLPLLLAATLCPPTNAQAPTAKAVAPAPLKLRYRWLYLAQNLQVDENVPVVQNLLKRAKAAGYNGAVLADYKLSVLDRVTPNYFVNLAAVKKTADDLRVGLYPTVCPFGYSSGLLSHNPNLAEGLPVKDATFVVHNQTADIAPLSAPFFPNGGFERLRRSDTANELADFSFIDEPGNVSFADRTVKHSGEQSLRFERPAHADPARIRDWLSTAAHLPNHAHVEGVLYTTWQNRYEDLEAFAHAAWSSSSF